MRVGALGSCLGACMHSLRWLFFSFVLLFVSLGHIHCTQSETFYAHACIPTTMPSWTRLSAQANRRTGNIYRKGYDFARITFTVTRILRGKHTDRWNTELLYTSVVVTRNVTSKDFSFSSQHAPRALLEGRICSIPEHYDEDYHTRNSESRGT